MCTRNGSSKRKEKCYAWRVREGCRHTVGTLTTLVVGILTSSCLTCTNLVAGRLLCATYPTDCIIHQLRKSRHACTNNIRAKKRLVHVQLMVSPQYYITVSTMVDSWEKEKAVYGKINITCCSLKSSSHDVPWSINASTRL